MLLERLQTHLEDIYEVQTPHRVNDFVIDDPDLVAQLDGGDNAREIPEKLLIHQDGENIDIALYLDAELVKRLEDNDPTQSLHNHNICDFWLALEGISHFLYFTWNAEFERGVSLLELELQAEVDKYVLAVHLLEQQIETFCPTNLHYHLFQNASFDSRLNREELFRYRSANDLAAKFCAYIKDCLKSGMAQPQITNHLRRFYRLNHFKKVDAIARL
jgi:hypothetical protein